MIGLVIIGDEILSGRRKDQHLNKAIDLLAERGLSLSWVRYVGDDPPRITQDLHFALSTQTPVFSFGGIGATPDDHTRACAADALGVPLVMHPEARELILERCRVHAEQEGQAFDPNDADTLRRLEMGVFPQGAEIIPNPYNQIPGFSLLGRVHFLPGFPVMAWPMMAWVLDHRHKPLHGSGAQASQAVVLYGAIESRLTPLMLEIQAKFLNVKVFSLPSVDHPVHGRHVELGIKGDLPTVEAAFAFMLAKLHDMGASIGPKLVRTGG